MKFVDRSTIEHEGKGFLKIAKNLQRANEFAWDSLLRLNMDALKEYDFTDRNGYKLTADMLQQTASPDALSQAHRDLDAFQESLAHALCRIGEKEATKGKPRYVLVKTSLNQIWGWHYPQELRVAFQIWCDFGDVPERADATTIDIEKEKLNITETYGRLLAILQLYLDQGLSEQGYRVIV